MHSADGAARDGRRRPDSMPRHRIESIHRAAVRNVDRLTEDDRACEGPREVPFDGHLRLAGLGCTNGVSTRSAVVCIDGRKTAPGSLPYGWSRQNFAPPGSRQVLQLAPGVTGPRLRAHAIPIDQPHNLRAARCLGRAFPSLREEVVSPTGDRNWRENRRPGAAEIEVLVVQEGLISRSEGIDQLVPIRTEL